MSVLEKLDRIFLKLWLRGLRNYYEAMENKKKRWLCWRVELRLIVINVCGEIRDVLDVGSRSGLVTDSR